MPATSLSAPSGLNSPYGGTLIDLRVDEARAAEMRATAKDYASLSLDEWGLCDLELLATGAFSPLDGFLNRADYERVVAEMRLADGTLWPLPIALPVTPGAGVAEGQPLALRDVYGNLLAFLHVRIANTSLEKKGTGGISRHTNATTRHSVCQNMFALINLVVFF